MVGKSLYVGMGGAIVVALVIFVMIFTEDAQPVAEDRILVYASFFPYYEFTKNIAGDMAVIMQYLPAGVEAHDWEPRPGEIRSLQDADIFIYNGVGMEPYIENLMKSGDFKDVMFVKATSSIDLLESGKHVEEFHGEIVDIIKEFEMGHLTKDMAFEGIESIISKHGGDNYRTEIENIKKILDEINSDMVSTKDGLEEMRKIVSTEDKHKEPYQDRHDSDPHVWLDPILVKQQVEIIRDSLIEADPKNAKHYEKNAAEYNAKLDVLDAEIRLGISNCTRDTFVPFHNSFAYFAERYGLGVFSIGGIAPDAEATAAEIVTFVDHVRENDISVIFSEDLVDPRLAKVIAEEAGAEVMIFSPIEALTSEETASGVTFLGKMRQNLDVLREALECQ